MDFQLIVQELCQGRRAAVVNLTDDDTVTSDAHSCNCAVSVPVTISVGQVQVPVSNVGPYGPLRLCVVAPTPDVSLAGGPFVSGVPVVVGQSGGTVVLNVSAIESPIAVAVIDATIVANLNQPSMPLQLTSACQGGT